MTKKMFVLVFVAFVTAIVAANGCAYSHIAAPTGGILESDCGEFDSAVVGVPPFYTPAGQYATYRGACAQAEFARMIRLQREAVTRAGWAAVQKVHAVDPQARKMARTALRLSRTTSALVASEEGGAR